MKRISKSQQADITEAMNECQAAGQSIESLVDQFNEVLAEWREKFSEAADHYNEKVADFREVYSDLAGKAREYLEERSDKWRESEAGEIYEQWASDMENVEAEEVEIDFPDDLEQPNLPDWQSDEWLPPNTPGDE